ncbi:MAG: peptidoglycan-binding domain-containing protein [Ardenticatenaceae bacterium]|nr:peptidoglycan-binding domain-containing protein [Ardenticatenaceae bacterium]
MAEWNSLRQRRTPGQTTSERDTWGIREYQHMLQTLAFYPGRVDGDHGRMTDDAVEAFRRHRGLPPGTAVDDPVWEALIRAYLGLEPLKLNLGQLLPNCTNEPLKWIGCGEKDPVRNTQAAWRPNRRTEMVIVSAASLPCEIPVPDTLLLPSPNTGAAGQNWCLDNGGATTRCCFIVPAQDQDPCPQNGQNKWCRPPRPPRFTLNGTIKKEVRLPDGTIRLDPAPQQKFVLTAPDGEFKQSERSNGEPNPARTDGNGAFTFDDMPPGVFSLEVIPASGSVLVRLEEETAENVRGNVVCKDIRSAQVNLNVVILAAPPLREITLPVVAHLMTAHDGNVVLHQTTRDKNDIEQLINRVNQIWEQARIRFEVKDFIEATYQPPPPAQSFVNQAEFFFILANCAAQNVINIFFVQDIEDPTAYFVAAPNSGAAVPGIAIEDLATDQLSTEFMAQALGNFLELPLLTDPSTLDRLMHAGLVRSGTVISDAEVDTARASEASFLEYNPITISVTGGATQLGGTQGSTFVVLRDDASGPITVEAQIPPAQLATGTATMTGGTEVPGFPLRRNVVRNATGRTEVVTTFTMPVTTAAGTVMHTYQTTTIIAVFELTVDVEGADRAGASGSNIFVTQQADGEVITLTANITPAADIPRCVPQDFVQWSGGDPVPGNPLQRTVPKGEPGQTEVRVTFAGRTQTFDIRVYDLAFVRDAAPFDDEIDPVNWLDALRVRADLPGETRDEITIEITSYLLRR